MSEFSACLVAIVVVSIPVCLLLAWLNVERLRLKYELARKNNFLETSRKECTEWRQAFDKSQANFDKAQEFGTKCQSSMLKSEEKLQSLTRELNAANGKLFDVQRVLNGEVVS